MGFCLFGNAAIAAHHARQARDVQRLAIVDWDVHHGNGTQAAFYDDPSVLTISLHVENNYPPGSGPLEEIGDGAGRGANLNLPLPAGSGVGAYVAAFERVVVPALMRFRPDVILVASGFDASALDPMGRMMLTPECFAGLTEQLMEVAAELCENRLVIAHEGGYSTEFTPFCGLVTIEALSGLETECRNTMLHMVAAGMGGQDLQPHQDAAVARGEELPPDILAP